MELFASEYAAVCANVLSLCTGVPVAAGIVPNHMTPPPAATPNDIATHIPPAIIDTSYEARAKNVGAGGPDGCWGYKGAKFDRLVADALIQVESVSSESGAVSVYGTSFVQATPASAASLVGELGKSRGFVGAAAHEDGSLASEFFITLGPTPWLDPTETIVFGRVTDGLSVLDALNKVPVDEESETPLMPIVITQCGQW